MTAQIIPFPKLKSVNEGMASVSKAAMQHCHLGERDPASRLHIVRPSALGKTQRTALRIVEDVCLEHHLVHPAMEPERERTLAFWATLPIPPARVETPLSVARRLTHLILPMVEHA